MRRSRLKPFSVKRRQKIKDEDGGRKAYIKAHPTCEAMLAGAPGACYGQQSVHEVVPRGRGGDTGDVRIYKAVCWEHNRAISQDAETMMWAMKNGFLFHSYRDFEEQHGG